MTYITTVMDAAGPGNVDILRKEFCVQTNRPRKVSALVAAVVATSAFVLAIPEAGAAATPLAAACLDHEIPAAVLSGKATPLIGADCDLRGRTVRAGELGVVVPSSGNRGATIFGTFAERTGEMPHSLSVMVKDDLVTVAINSDLRDRAAVDSGNNSGAGSPKPPEYTAADVVECVQDAHTWTGNHQGYLDWAFTIGSTPAYFSDGLAEADLRAGALNIDNGNNDCGLSTPIGATDTEYLGRTLNYPDITATPACDNARSENNEVAFGSLPGGILAVTCTWWYAWPGDNPIVEADMRFNNANNLYFYTLPTLCAGRYELQGVATHEFGHAFGLDHVSESDYPTMTMSPTATPCSYSDSTLGLGDYNGLEAHY